MDFIIGFGSLVLSYLLSYFIIGELNFWFFPLMTVLYILFLIGSINIYYIIKRKLKC